MKRGLLSKSMINNDRTLLIIDNYNVDPDSDEYKRNVEVMKDLKNCIFIFYLQQGQHLMMII